MFRLIGRAATIVLLTTSAVSATTLEIRVFDSAGELIPCRVHLKDSAGVAQHADKLPFWHDHFVCPGRVELTLPVGKYEYQIERGPEFQPASGAVELTEHTKGELSVNLQRIADMASVGWWSGELHVHRGIEEIPLHLRAEDLHVAPVITWWNARNLWRDRAVPATTLVKIDDGHYFDVMAGEDEREGGALLYFRLKRPLPLPGSMQSFPEHPSPMKFVELARKSKDVWIDIEKPFWWDTPIWLASGQIDSIGLANNHMCRDSMYKDEAWGKPRDTGRLPAPRGNGFWSQEIYYHVLNCGLRIPPSAGSASGALPNPVGYNRVYVYLGEQFTYDGWWQGLKQGRALVTNGPLLLCRANDQLPGHVFQSDGPLRINVSAEVISSDRVPAWEVIQDGQIVQSIPLEQAEKSKPSTALTFERSGWFLMRAVANNPKTFRFASTAPYYVEIGSSKARVSRRSARFFLDWLDERVARVRQKLQDPEKLREVLKFHDDAKAFWLQVLNRANAD